MKRKTKSTQMSLDNKRVKELTDYEKVCEQNETRSKLPKIRQPNVLDFTLPETRWTPKMKSMVFSSAENAYNSIRMGNHEVVLLEKDKVTNTKLTETLKRDIPNLFLYYNDFVKDEFQVPDPKLEWLLDPVKHSKELKSSYLKSGKAVCGLKGGMLNLYGGHTADLHLQDNNFKQLMNKIYGGGWQVHPNRMRLNICANKMNTMSNGHLEGMHVGKDTWMEEDLAFICSISKKRAFTYWDGTASDSSIRADVRKYFNDNGGNHFTKITGRERFLYHENGSTRRTRIVFPNTHILLFVEAVAHEVDDSLPSFSLFLSPFDPVEYSKTSDLVQKEFKSLVDAYKANNSKLVCQQARKLIRQMPNEWKVHFPLCFRSWLLEKNYYDPEEFTDDLLHRDTEIIGWLRGYRGGVYWPSGKKLFHGPHIQAFNTYIPRSKRFTTLPHLAFRAQDRELKYRFPDGHYAITEEVLETFDLIPKCMLGTKSLFDVMKRYQNNMEVAYRRGLCSKTNNNL